LSEKLYWLAWYESFLWRAFYEKLCEKRFVRLAFREEPEKPA